MLRKLENWVKKINDEKLNELYTGYQNTEKFLEEQRAEIFSYLSKLPEFDNLMSKALETCQNTPSEETLSGQHRILASAGAKEIELKDEEVETPKKQIKTGKDFKNARKSKYLTQEQAAQKLGIQLHMIRTWEQKKNEIPKPYLAKANKILNI